MQMKFKNYKETSEDKAKCNLLFMARLDSNVYQTFVMFKSFQFSSELCFLGDSSFEAQRKIKIFNFLNFTIEIYHYRIFFFMKTSNNFFMKPISFETFFL